MALMPLSSNLVFKVHIRQQELLTPSKPTPRELKPLSDIDDQGCLRSLLPFIHFYKRDPAMEGRDPVNLIRQALRETLVYFYPLAGRIHEAQDRKFVVDCNGEGIVFVEADADIALQEIGHNLHPPFPCFDQLLCDVHGCSGVTNSPLLHVQVTRLRCGGFVLALRVNHTMCDSEGLAQFLTAVGEMARGASEPSVPPVWSRDVLSARSPPRITCLHREFDEIERGTFSLPLDVTYMSFFFGEDEMRALRRHAPDHLQDCTTFEILTACLWRCRTAAIQADSEEEVYMIFPVNVRRKFPLPPGYYGNGFVLPAAVATAKELCSRPLEYALDLVRKTKYSVNEEYVRSVADFMVTRGRPSITLSNTFSVSDVRHLGFSNVDFGGGKAAYGGLLMDDQYRSVLSFLQNFTTTESKTGIVVPIYLPSSFMEQFVVGLNKMLMEKSN